MCGKIKFEIEFEIGYIIKYDLFRWVVRCQNRFSIFDDTESKPWEC